MTTTHVLECAWTWTGHCGQLCSRRVDGCAARGQRWEAATVASGTPMRAVSTTAESGPPGTPSLGGQSSGVVDRQHEPPPDFRTLGPVGSSPWRSPCRVGPARHPWIWPTSRRPTRSLTPAYARRGRRPFPAHPPRMGTSHDRGTHTHPAARPHGPRKRWRRAGGGGGPVVHARLGRGGLRRRKAADCAAAACRLWAMNFAVAGRYIGGRELQGLWCSARRGVETKGVRHRGGAA